MVRLPMVKTNKFPNIIKISPYVDNDQEYVRHLNDPPKLTPGFQVQLKEAELVLMRVHQVVHVAPEVLLLAGLQS